MKSALTVTRTDEIIRLHNEVIGALKTSLEKAIRIGELLTDQKETMAHGAFLPWVKENLPFTDRTARNYMRLHRERDRLKTETVSDLKSAYKLLAPPKSETFEQIIREVGFDCENCKFPVEAKTRGRHLLCLQYLKAADPNFDLEPIIYRIIMATEHLLDKEKTTTHH